MPQVIFFLFLYSSEEKDPNGFLSHLQLHVFIGQQRFDPTKCFENL